jgi:hypothetical protein
MGPQDNQHKDTQHNDIQHYDTQHKGLSWHSAQQYSAIMLSVIFLSVGSIYFYVDCRCAKCRYTAFPYAKCPGAVNRCDIFSYEF